MTLNQQYRKSGTTKSFKEWLFDQQKQGNVDLDKMMDSQNFSATGKENDKMGISILGIPVLYWGIGVALLTVGAIAYKKYSK